MHSCEGLLMQRRHPTSNSRLSRPDGNSGMLPRWICDQLLEMHCARPQVANCRQRKPIQSGGKSVVTEMRPNAGPEPKELPRIRDMDPGTATAQAKPDMKSPLLSLTATAACAAVLALTSGCAGNPSRQSTGEYIDDNATTSRVERALRDDPQFKFLMVEVKTFKGTAQLSGFAASSEAKKRAGEIAVTVPGVRTVQNDILVKDGN